MSLTKGAAVRGIVPDGVATVVAVEWFGDALQLTYMDATGRVGQRILYHDNEPSLEVITLGRRWSFGGDGALLRLVSEACRSRQPAQQQMFETADKYRTHGHNVPEPIVRRRYEKGLRNFFRLYMPLVDSWQLFDNSVREPRLIAAGEDTSARIGAAGLEWRSLVERYRE